MSPFENVNSLRCWTPTWTLDVSISGRESGFHAAAVLDLVRAAQVPPPPCARPRNPACWMPWWGTTCATARPCATCPRSVATCADMPRAAL